MIVSVPRRMLPVVVCTGFVFIVLMIRTFSSNSWQSLPLEKIGLGEAKIDDDITIITPGGKQNHDGDTDGMQSVEDEGQPEVEMGKLPDKFPAGTAKPPGSTYTKMLIVPKTKAEDTTWIDENFPVGGPMNTSMYIADDPTAPLHPPKNKGNEVMIYLTYIIDNYDNLADVNIFIHAHRFAWHNDELLDSDSAQMVGRLSAERVQREGYMNLRCHWYPGCPDWMHPGTTELDVNKQEEQVLAQSWSELFPMDSIPTVLAQPCCAQFALSRERIRALPKARYVFYRDWMLRTPLRNHISGRVWEYVWHYLFTGQNIMCPEEHVCYCDGFGVCFGGKQEYNSFYDKVHEKSHHQDRLKVVESNAQKIKEMEEKGEIDEIGALDVPKNGEAAELKQKINELGEYIQKEKEKAIERGANPANRAKEAGRPWKEGDGY
ncbi:hypothetical protein ACLOAV_010551 [Pseudogymnoascus australis]